jgi:hypothetical protein
LSARIMALASSCFPLVADVDSCPKRSKFITFSRQFVNISIQSHTLRHGNACRLHKNVRISASLTPPAHKTFCSSLVQIEGRGHMFTTQKLLAHWGRWSAIMKVRQSEYSVKCWQVPAAYHLTVSHKKKVRELFEITSYSLWPQQQSQCRLANCLITSGATCTLHSELFAWWQAAQQLPMFQYAVSQCPSLLIQYIKDNIRFLLKISKDDPRNIFLRLADTCHI